MAAASPAKKTCVYRRKAYNAAPGFEDKFAHAAHWSAGGIVLNWPPNRDEAVPYP